MAGPPDLVRDAARTSDPDRYVMTLYAPEDMRAALLALYAFDAEIAAVRGRIREAMVGELRLQWWRDAIDAPFAVTGHPVADALNAAIARHGLPVTGFHNYLDARVFDLYDDPMPSRTDLEGYCGETAGAILQLAALVLDPQAAPRVAEPAGRAGCAQAITWMLRMLPVHRARGQCFVPRDLLAAAGSSPEEFLKDGKAEGSLRAIEAMTALAREHMRAFHSGATTIPITLRPAFLPLAVTALQLQKMTSAKRVSEGIADIAVWRKQWAVFRRASKGWPGF